MPKVIIRDDVKDSLNIQFAKWVYSKTCDNDGVPNGRIVSHNECALKMRQLKGDNQLRIVDGQLRGWISNAREYFEENFNCTIWPVSGKGWRASTKVETARWCGKSARRTLAWAERTRRLFLITEKKYIPYMIREVMGGAEAKISSLAGYRKNFLEHYLKFQTTEKKELEQNGQKLIENKK